MTKLGKYEILEEIGRGGFAVVYKARDTSLDRVVALKVLHSQLTADPKFVQRFHQEAQTAARLHHPHIVTIYEVGEEAGQHYLAMTFPPGHTLDERLAVTKGPLPVELAISIVEQIADALDTIHQQGLVHRDAKPANIMIDRNGQATLLDFGIVRAAEGTRLTMTMAVLGTPEYMAPEQADPAEVKEIDWRADIYALGVVAYEMLVGRPPFTGKSPTKVLYQHVHEPPPAPTTLTPDLPVALEPVLLKALAKGREGRFQSGGALATELRRSLALVTEPQPLARDDWAPSRAVKTTAWCLLGAGILFLPAFGTGIMGIMAAIAMLKGDRLGRKIGLVFSILLEVVGLCFAGVLLCSAAIERPVMDRICWLFAILVLAATLIGTTSAHLLGREAVVLGLGEKPKHPAGIWPIAVP